MPPFRQPVYINLFIDNTVRCAVLLTCRGQRHSRHIRRGIYGTWPPRTRRAGPGAKFDVRMSRLRIGFRRRKPAPFGHARRALRPKTAAAQLPGSCAAVHAASAMQCSRLSPAALHRRAARDAYSALVCFNRRLRIYSAPASANRCDAPGGRANGVSQSPRCIRRPRTRRQLIAAIHPAATRPASANRCNTSISRAPGVS